MFLFKIFKLRKLYKEFKQNPNETIAGQITDIAKEVAVIPFVILGLVLVVFFILGFTSILFDSLLFFRVFFILGLLVFIVSFIFVRFILRVLFKTVSQQSQKIL